MSRTERLFDLIQLLRTYRYPVTATRLSDQLGVTVRTIYRDIATLQAIGAPVEGEAGVGYLLRPGFLLPPLMFSKEEIEALVLGARWVWRRGDSRLGRAARSALSRIEAVLPSGRRQEVEEAPLIVGQGVDATAQDSRLFSLREAIVKQKKVRLQYRSVGGELTERVIWPFALSFFDTVYLVVSWCELRRDYRTFRLDLIEMLDILPAVYPRNRASLMQEWQDREGIPRQDLGNDPDDRKS